MVLEMSMYFEKTPIGILVPFPYLIFFSHQTLLFFALYLYRRMRSTKCAWFEEEISNGFRDLDIF